MRLTEGQNNDDVVLGTVFLASPERKDRPPFLINVHDGVPQDRGNMISPLSSRDYRFVPLDKLSFDFGTMSDLPLMPGDVIERHPVLRIIPSRSGGVRS